jgi:hypothetical protein
MTGQVIKTLRPGAAGTRKWAKKFGRRLVCVRYRGDVKRRKRLTTVEIVVDEGFYNPEGYRNHKKAMSSIGHSI